MNDVSVPVVSEALARRAIGLFLVPFVVLFVALGLLSQGDVISDRTTAACLLVGVVVLLAATLADVWKRLPDPREALGLRSTSIKWFVLAVVAVPVKLIIESPVIQAFESDDGESAQSGLEQVPIAFIIIFVALVVPLLEELFARGVVFGGFRSRGLAVALGVSVVVFVVMHLTANPGIVFGVGLLGVITALLYEWSGSLWPSILHHVVNNSLAAAIILSSS